MRIITTDKGEFMFLNKTENSFNIKDNGKKLILSYGNDVEHGIEYRKKYENICPTRLRIIVGTDIEFNNNEVIFQLN